MKNSIKLFSRVFTVILFILFVSCKSRSPQSDEHIILDMDSLIDDNPIKFSDIFQSFDIIPLESNEDCMFGSINDINFCDSFIYITDRHETQLVYRFSINGDFINKIGKLGRGPGEYIQPIDVNIDTKKGIVSVYDWLDKEIVDYDQNGNYLKTRFTNQKFFQFRLTDERIITYSPFPREAGTKNEKMIKIMNDSGRIISSYLEYQNYIQGPRISETTLGGNFFKSVNDIKFFSNYIDTIYSIKDNTCIPFMILSTKKYHLTQKEVDAFNVESLREKVSAKYATQKMMNICKYSENDSIAYFSFQIGGSTYHMFYDYFSKKAKCSNRFEDDLTFIRPNLCKISGNKFMATVFTGNTERFIKIIGSKNIQLSADAKLRLQNMTNLSNPLLIVYALKNKLP